MKSFGLLFLISLLSLAGCFSSPQSVVPEPATPPEITSPAAVSTPLPPGEEVIPPSAADPLPTAAPENKILPFNTYQALRDAEFHFRPPEYPVRKQGRILHITHDLNRDGLQEVIVPGVEVEQQEEAEFEFLSDLTRLYNKDKKAIKFYIYIFTQSQGTYRLVDRIDLGYHHVLKSFQKLYIHKNRGTPLAVSTTFQTREGDYHSWIIYRPPGFQPLSILTFENTIHKQVLVEDIDNDEMLDVVIREKHAEEMKGVETYLLWKKWTGHAFVEHRYTNVVRNLNLFLKDLREKILQGGDGKALFEFAIDSEVLREEQNTPVREILQKYLGIRVFTDQEDGLLGEIREIIFPEILDDPFYLSDDQGSYFPLSFRVVYDGNIALVSEAYLYMYKNPFNERQFTFMTPLAEH